jgi:hypothetical protein
MACSVQAAFQRLLRWQLPLSDRTALIVTPCSANRAIARRHQAVRWRRSRRRGPRRRPAGCDRLERCGRSRRRGRPSCSCRAPSAVGCWAGRPTAVDAVPAAVRVLPELLHVHVDQVTGCRARSASRRRGSLSTAVESSRSVSRQPDPDGPTFACLPNDKQLRQRIEHHARPQHSNPFQS